MAAYYNEIDPELAQWLRNLIAAGHIAPGDVDERSIEDVHPDDLRPYVQCHFFAGIGVWSYALRLAGWGDDRPVWTGSCPCQPFSAAGKGGGFADQRHLWPAFEWLIRQRRPPVVFGEQVASKDALAWLDLVQDDLESAGYAVWAVDLCAAGVGAPHIRQRLYWVAYADGAGLEGRCGAAECAAERPAGPGGVAGGVANADRWECGGEPVVRGALCDGPDAGRSEGGCQPGACCEDGLPGPVNGFWRDADWIACRDGVWRPVGPGTFPLVDGAAARVVRLRAYGNAIVAPLATTFVAAFMDATGRGA